MVQSSSIHTPPNVGANVSQRLVRLPEVMHRTGLSRSTIYRHMDLGQFPRPHAIGSRIVAWRESDIDLWIADKFDRSR
jgi:prophage regulatory protein